jgi:hypothetical protein
MKTFRWVTLLNGTGSFITLLDVTQGHIVTACGTLVPENGLFHVLVTNPQTYEKLTINELLPLDEAKSAVEKKLFDDGIIEDGDLLEDYTEE